VPVRVWPVLAIVALSCRPADEARDRAPDLLPAKATAKLSEGLAAAADDAEHAWRDGAPFNADGTVNAYVEIRRGDRRKWEFDIGANRRVIDRVLPGNVGGYPVNYGFVPQTVAYDGDPFDALVLGPPLPGGEMVSGIVVGLMRMEDAGEPDPKVVLSPAGPDGRPRYRLEAQIRKPIEEFFERYKLWDPGERTRVPGWGSADEGAAAVALTHRFFNECGRRAGRECRIDM
jgi:inorganic pyrophosphatase